MPNFSPTSFIASSYFFLLFIFFLFIFSFFCLSLFLSHDHPLLPLLFFSLILFLSLYFSLPSSLSLTFLSSISLSHISTTIFTPIVHLTIAMSHFLHHHSPSPITSSTPTTKTFISMVATSILALGFFKTMRWKPFFWSLKFHRKILGLLVGLIIWALVFCM